MQKWLERQKEKGVRKRKEGEMKESGEEIQEGIKKKKRTSRSKENGEKIRKE